MDPQVLRGFRDYLPADMIPRQQLIHTIERVFERYGFAPLQTPAVEYSELLLGKYGDEGDKLLFRFRDNGDRDVALRYDLTVPLARVLGTHRETPLPFKRYHVGPVWRAEKPARGRFREFVQCDVDTVGVEGQAADAEVIAAGIDALRHVLTTHDTPAARATRNGQPAFTLRMSNRKLLNGMCAVAGISDDKSVGVFRTLDKLDKQGEPAVRELLVKDCALDAAAIDRVFAYLSNPATAQNLAPLEKYFEGVEVGLAGVREVQTVVSLVTAHGFAEYLELDLSIARGLDYYTGSIYETSLNGLPGFGSVMSGGRYDKLLGMFCGKDIPAVGISVGLDRLLAGLQELGLVTAKTTPATVLVTVFDDRLHSTALAQRLRAAGINTEVALNDDKLGKQFRHADRMKLAHVIIAGPDERAAGVVKLKNLATGVEQSLSEAAVIEYLSKENA